MSDETGPIQPPESAPAPSDAAPQPAPAPWDAAPTPAGAAPAPQPAPAIAPPMASAPPRGSGAGTIAIAVLAALIVGAIAGAGGGFVAARMTSGGGTSYSAQKVTVVPATTDEPVVAAASAAVPSIVNIDITGTAAAAGQNGLPNSHPSVPIEGSGSGVAFKKVPSGGTYILTNNHVVDGAKQITVSDTTGKTFTGTLVGRDPDSDIAVVRISEDLPIIALGDSAKLLVGQTAVAIGSPFGFEHSVTSGVISALGRQLSNVGDSSGSGYPLVDVIQTDAAINPGNSGGALVDRAGRLIGINTAIYSGASLNAEASNAGIGFAIPVNTAARVANELIAGGSVAHPYIGLVGSTIDAAVATMKKLPVQSGAYVESVGAGGGAKKAGVKPGDVVISADGTPVRTMEDLIAAVRHHAIGETVKLTLRRGSQTLTLDVVVGDKPANLPAPSIPSSITTP
jgi:putative serine protease PepD